MKRLVVREFMPFARADLDSRHLEQLQRFDQACAAESGKAIFDWTRRDTVRALNYVGVIQIPGLTVEILPKISDLEWEALAYEGSPDHERAQRNLLYMLAVAGELPFEERLLAHQRLECLPLLEVLITVFGQAVVRELRRGVTRAYVEREENLAFVKGALLHAQNARLNSVRRDRNYVRYDDFLPDTPLNRIIRATCRRLQALPLRQRTQLALHAAALELADVSDVHVTLEMFERVHLDRNTQRFGAILEFCRMVLLRQTAAPSLGGARTFSLLFPMETVFEQFVGCLIRQNARALDLNRAQVRLQSAGTSRWLARTEQGQGRFRLRPDVLIHGPDGSVQTVLDTKWKRLKSDAEDSKNGVSQADVYQLYAYAHRFDSPDNVLLFPGVPGVSPKRYHLHEDAPRRIRVEFLDLDRDLHRERADLLGELRDLLVVDGPLRVAR